MAPKNVKVSLVTNLLNLALDPFIIFGLGKSDIAAPSSVLLRIWNRLGASGAAAATSILVLTLSHDATQTCPMVETVHTVIAHVFASIDTEKFGNAPASGCTQCSLCLCWMTRPSADPSGVSAAA